MGVSGVSSMWNPVYFVFLCAATVYFANASRRVDRECAA